MTGPIGIFDSGYGGLTVFKEIAAQLPLYDYIYLGDNARAPYGGRSFEVIYKYTLECVETLFNMGCPLVILACNTASAKALRTIQQQDLQRWEPWRRVLGVIRPTAEIIGNYTQTGQIGILATAGTVQSASYLLEIAHFFPELQVHQEACPMWVPLIENQEHEGAGADFFVQKNITRLLHQAPQMDTLVLGCTHYPLMWSKIRQFTPASIRLLSQGPIVAQSLADYLIRHPEKEQRCSKGGSRTFLTTEADPNASEKGSLFYGQPLFMQQIELN